MPFRRGDRGLAIRNGSRAFERQTVGGSTSISARTGMPSSASRDLWTFLARMPPWGGDSPSCLARTHYLGRGGRTSRSWSTRSGETITLSYRTTTRASARQSYHERVPATSFFGIRGRYTAALLAPSRPMVHNLQGWFLTYASHQRYERTEPVSNDGGGR